MVAAATLRNRYLLKGTEVFLHFNIRSGTLVLLNVSSASATNVSGLCSSTGTVTGPFVPSVRGKWPGLELGNEMASEQSQLHGILGEQDLRPSTHCVTLQG